MIIFLHITVIQATHDVIVLRCRISFLEHRQQFYEGPEGFTESLDID
jgi:hypothetical protein